MTWSNKRRFLLPAVLSAILCATTAAHAQSEADLAEQKALSEQLQHGKRLAEANCQQCHAIGIEGNSPHPTAPPFWSISERRPVDTVARMLLNHMKPEGTDMPTFQITEKQATDIATWINWVQPTSHGKRLVEANCGACHATGLTDESPHADAPPFRELHKRYPIEALEEAFAEGIESGHPDMPVFNATVTQLSDILAYIATLSTEE